MLGYWIFNNGEGKNYGSSGYGSILSKKENIYKLGPTKLEDFYYSFNAENISGQILTHDDFSFGMVGLNSGQIPFAKFGGKFYKPDNKFAVSSAEWSLYYRKEQFGDQDCTLSFYKNGQEIYSQGLPKFDFNNDITFCQTGLSLKLYDSLPINPINAPPIKSFGAVSGSISSGISLILGGAIQPLNSSMTLCMGAVNACYLLDESGVILYDESLNPLLDEICVQYGGLMAGFDMSISGEAFVDFIMPLYLKQGDTTNPISSGIPLYLYNTQNILSNSVNLTLLNNYGSIGSGVNLYIGNLDSDNDGYVPINSGIPLFIQRNENTYFNLMISGGTTSLSGAINLYLNANRYPISGITNLSMPYVKDVSSSGTFLYTAGF